jgi:Rrf2 family protein
LVRLSKKVEYGLIAIRHIAAHGNGSVVSAKEIAECYHISYELLSKVLQRLTKAGLILSHQGVHGGYALARSPDEVRVSAIINAIEGSIPMIARCMSEGPESCGVFDLCTIKSPLSKVQANIERAFSSMTLQEIV